MLVGSADMLQLHMVLHHLEMLDNVVLQQDTVHPLAQVIIDGSIDRPGREADPAPSGQCCNFRVNIIAGQNLHTCLCQRSRQGIGNAFPVAEQDCLVLTDHGKAGEQRAGIHIAAAQVVKPAEAVQRAHYIAVQTQLFHLFPHQLQLLADRQASIVLGIGKGHAGGQCRTVLGPELIHQTQIGAQGDVIHSALFPQFQYHGSGSHPSVEGNGAAGGYRFEQIVRQGNHTGVRSPEQGDTASAELAGSLQIIASIGPETGLLLGYYNRARRSGESGDPAALPIVFRQIFAHVFIGIEHDICINAVCSHLISEGGNSLLDSHKSDTSITLLW